MQIHTTLLSWDTNSNRQASEVDRAQTEASDYRRGLDEWFVRWKEFMSSLPVDETTANLRSWGQFNYYQGIFLLSLLWPTPGATTVCCAVADASQNLIQHQQLFSRPCTGSWQKKPLVVFPVTWTTSHAILKVFLHTCISEAFTVDEKNEMAVSLERLKSLIMVLEADPDNLLTGMSVILSTPGLLLDQT